MHQETNYVSMIQLFLITCEFYKLLIHSSKEFKIMRTYH